MRFLKDACPAGLKAMPSEPMEAGAAGMVASQVRRECRRGDGGIVLTLTDLQAADGMATSIRQLGKLKPYPGSADGFLEYDKKTKKGKAQLVAGRRFVFGATAEGVSEKELRTALTMFDAEGISVYKPTADDLLIGKD